MSNTKDIVYGLYAMKPDAESISIATEFRYNRITPDYILVYSETVPDKSTEIKDEELCLLTDEDEEWLFECNTSIAEEYIAEKHHVLEQAKISFLDKFAEAIEKRMQEAASNSDGE